MEKVKAKRARGGNSERMRVEGKGGNDGERPAGC